jgi:hypothetical protein
MGKTKRENDYGLWWDIEGSIAIPLQRVQGYEGVLLQPGMFAGI